MPRLDASGKLCPLPVLLAAREIERMEPGQVLELVGDDPAILEDVPAWCQQTGHVLLSMDEDGETIRCRIKKVAGGGRSLAELRGFLKGMKPGPVRDKKDRD